MIQLVDWRASSGKSAEFPLIFFQLVESDIAKVFSAFKRRLATWKKPLVCSSPACTKALLRIQLKIRQHPHEIDMMAFDVPSFDASAVTFDNVDVVSNSTRHGSTIAMTLFAYKTDSCTMYASDS
jgi:hypothetical protein